MVGKVWQGVARQGKGQEGKAGPQGRDQCRRGCVGKVEPTREGSDLRVCKGKRQAGRWVW